MNKDRLFENRPGSDPFRFDEAVVKVFPDMLRRSIPGYAASIEAIGSLAGRYVQPNTNCYDLGCSLGAASIAMRQGAATNNVNVIAVDKSPAMIERCRQVLETGNIDGIELQEADILDIDIQDASMVVLNYTLQFLSIAERSKLVGRIYEGLLPGGLLLLSEKVIDEDPHMEELLVDLHLEHKRRNDYSELEISRKRQALENVLIPEKISTHRERLSEAGFSHSAVWLRYFNFVSIIAIRQ